MKKKAHKLILNLIAYSSIMVGLAYNHAIGFILFVNGCILFYFIISLFEKIVSKNERR